MADPVNAETVHLIMSCEGCVLHTYEDSTGVPTIGYGHTGPDVAEGMEINQAGAQALLERDLAKFEDGVDNLLTGDTGENEFGAMVSLAYNVGLGNFEGSSVLRLHNEGNKTGAANAFLLWNKAGGEVLAGLTRRRQQERALYLKPDTEMPAPPVLVTAPPRDDKRGLIAWLAEMLRAL